MPSGHEGLAYLVLLFFCVLFTDTGCYYFGTKFGKHKLAPVISPNKTIEGSIGGAVSAVIGALVIGAVINACFAEVHWYVSVIIGLICTIFAQIGDLCESAIKRRLGLKDSSNLIPGHGGVFDRIDGMLLAAPVLYLVIILL